MNYEDLIEELEPKLREIVESGHGGESELGWVLKAKSYHEQGIVPPNALRAKLRELWEAQVATPCDHIDKHGMCSWLSKKEAPGVTLPCPFYRDNEDPRGCGGYRAMSVNKLGKGLDVVSLRRGKKS